VIAMLTRAHVQAMLDVEAALAESEAALGLIPDAAARAIRDAARSELYDLAALEADATRDGNAAIPLIRELTARVSSVDADASHYVHWGATSQDIIDTAVVLELRTAVPAIVDDLKRASNAAAMHARRHAGTVMAGRTWLQQATPITFGLKAAGWVDALDRTASGLRAALDAAMVLQFGGASGTLAALGSRGAAVSARLAALLALAVPAIPWHAQRDRLVSLACGLGVATGTCGKIARDLGLLARFVGMVTDSRSFLSYSRHEYFRRLLCNLIGEDVRRGRLPDDRELLGEVVRGVCFVNAREYFGFEVGTAAATV
jgi:3-carboxy-cis,cis-muconate cycloisomerase